MNDTLLYRRFFVVAALVAVMGVITANVILETRTRGVYQGTATGGDTAPCAIRFCRTNVVILTIA